MLESVHRSGMETDSDDKPLPGSQPLQDVSETALWVAHYRAEETEKADPLFRDPLAKILVGDRGARVAELLKATAAHTRVNVVVRTVIIDRFISSLERQGVDLVLNLGAGLDTRPYRLHELPASLQWVEVDYSHLVNLKAQKLASHRPVVQLKRIGMDLANRTERQALFQSLGSQFKNVVVLTEGVLPYLTEQQVAELAEDLHAQPCFKYWIADYQSPDVYKYLRDSKRMKALRNTPFRFFPDDPFRFFKARGWTKKEIQYIPEVAGTLGIQMPAPWWIGFVKPFIPQSARERFMRSTGYMILTRD